MDYKESAQKIVKIFKENGISAEFIDYDFETWGKTIYARFEIYSNRNLEDLIRVLSEKFDRERENAEVQFEEIKPKEGFKFGYKAVIVPARRFSKLQLAEPTEELLNLLPEEIENYFKQHK